MSNFKKFQGYIYVIILVLIVAIGSILSTNNTVEELNKEYPTLTFEESISGKVSSTYRHPRLRYGNNVIHVIFQNEQKRTVQVISDAVNNSSISLEDALSFAANVEKESKSDTLIVTYFDNVYKFILKVE